MIASLVLPDELRVQLEREAREAFPRECCGLIEGAYKEGVAHATALHPTRNLSSDADRFEIDPAEQFRLMREAREHGTEIIGCYHSHPNGSAEPSPRDLEGAGEEDFLWLIAALTNASQPVALRAFVFQRPKFTSIPLVSGPSLDRPAA
ncbi:MAG TPA: M67 family metallopeptidase [Rhizomicrobium sp.]